MIDRRCRHSTQDSARDIRGAGNLQEVAAARMAHNETPYPIGRPPTACRKRVPDLIRPQGRHAGALPPRGAIAESRPLRIARQRIRVATVGAHQWPPASWNLCPTGWRTPYVTEQFVNR